MRDFSIVRNLSRRELERHEKRFTGITITEPRWAIQDENGAMEYVVDIRVGRDSTWSSVKNVLISQWAIGAITDINVPVLCERSEAGRVTIIARSEINLPDIRLDAYSYSEMEFDFMRNLEVRADGAVVDGFNYELRPPGSVDPDDFVLDLGEIDDVQVPPLIIDDEGETNRRPVFVNYLIRWGSTDFEYGVTHFGARVQGWHT